MPARRAGGRGSTARSGSSTGRSASSTTCGGRRYADLYPDREALCRRPQTVAGVIGAVPAVIGALEASEALKLLAGFGEPLDGRLFTIDLRSLETDIIEL